MSSPGCEYACMMSYNHISHWKLTNLPFQERSLKFQIFPSWTECCMRELLLSVMTGNYKQLLLSWQFRWTVIKEGNEDRKNWAKLELCKWGKYQHFTSLLHSRKKTTNLYTPAKRILDVHNIHSGSKCPKYELFSLFWLMCVSRSRSFLQPVL